MFIMQLGTNISTEKLKLSANNHFKYIQTQEEEEFGEIESVDCLFYLLCERLERANIVKFQVGRLW